MFKVNAQDVIMLLNMTKMPTKCKAYGMKMVDFQLATSRKKKKNTRPVCCDIYGVSERPRPVVFVKSSPSCPWISARKRNNKGKNFSFIVYYSFLLLGASDKRIEMMTAATDNPFISY